MESTLKNIKIEINSVGERKKLNVSPFLEYFLKNLPSEEILYYFIGSSSPIELPDIILSVMLVTKQNIYGYDFNINNNINNIVIKRSDIIYITVSTYGNKKELYIGLKDSLVKIVIAEDVNNIDDFDAFTNKLKADIYNIGG